MSILDKLRRSGSKAKEQAEHVVDQHGDKIATGIEKTGEVASKVTRHRFDDKIDKGVHKAKERLEHNGEPEGPPPTTAPPTPPPTAAEASTEPEARPESEKGGGTAGT